jgi:GT2 family glycosyltransferase
MDTVLFPLRGLRAAARAVRHPVRTGKLWTAARAIRKSGYFDEAYYCRENPEVRFLGFDPLMHFLEYGWREGRQPSEHFDVCFYLTAYADVRKSDECPLWHYLRHGQHENRLALPPGSAAAVEAPNRGAYLASFGEDHYGAWYTLHMQMHPAEERLYCQDMERFPRRPKVSILMPVYNTPGDLLRNAIDSVREQIYPDWELCIADDASSKAHIQPILDEYAELDDRIRICYRERNGHIAEASNSALELATGEYVAFLDHDDALTPDALYWQVKYLLAYPQTRLVYSDEDKLTLTGNLHSPHFKPDWNPDYFYSVNYLCHFTVMEADLARKTGGFRDTFNGAQDYDFFLRCIAQLQSDEIGHVPRILYHWRQAIGSTAATGDNKNYAREAGIKALEDHFRQTGVDATVENGPDSVVYQVRRIPPSPHPLVTIIIPTRNGAEYLERCVESIFARTEYENFEILVVDNESDEAATRELLDALRKRPRCEVLEAPGEFNFSAINNAAVEHARGEMVCLLNNDTEVVSPEWLTDMVGHCARSEVGAVGAKLLYPDDTIQHAGVGLGLGGVAGHMHKYYPADSAGYFGRLVATYDFSAVTAACLLARKEVYEEVGGLDETIFAVAFNDIDFCLRLRKAGYWNVYVPTAKLYHYESKSRGLEDSPQKQARFSAEVRLMKARWGASVLEQDGAYNPNLTLDSEDLHIAREPHSGWRRALQKAFDQAIAAAGQAKKPQRAASASGPSPSSPT